MDRPVLLREAVESCFRQEHRPFEILIGDDSSTDDSREVIAGLPISSDVALRYLRNETRLGQSSNVNRLLRSADGTHITLLHDDDLFCDNGLDQLVAGALRHPGALCVYGQQQLIALDGTMLPERTQAWSRRDRRSVDFAGPQDSPLRAALWCQPPNDAYLLDAATAKDVGYRSEEAVGHAVDADFMIRIAKTAKPGTFVLLPEVVSKYRLTPDSIARSNAINGRQDLFFRSLVADGDLEGEGRARDELLRRIGAAAVLDAALAGHRLESVRILASGYYDKPIFSRWTGYRLSCILSRRMGGRIKRLLDDLGPALGKS